MVLIFAKACIYQGNMQVHLQFFCQSKLQSTQKVRAATQMERSIVLQAKFCFMGCLVKVNALVLGNIALSSQLIYSISFYETAICREIFNKYFFTNISTFRKFQQCIKIGFKKFQKVHKNTPMVKSYVSKVTGFYRNNHQIHSVKMCSQKGVCKSHRKGPVSETLF